MVEVNGVGYHVHIPLSTFSAIQNLETATIYTHLIVREDAHTLFGFATQLERSVFIQLIGVTGVGFRIAIAAMDFLINVILCLPAAWALLHLGPRHIRANTLLALLSFAMTEAIALGVPTLSFGLASWFSYIASLLVLPVSVWLLLKLIGNASNYSFKPRPLRGSA